MVSAPMIAPGPRFNLMSYSTGCGLWFDLVVELSDAEDRLSEQTASSNERAQKPRESVVSSSSISAARSNEVHSQPHCNRGTTQGPRQRALKDSLSTLYEDVTRFKHLRIVSRKFRLKNTSERAFCDMPDAADDHTVMISISSSIMNHQVEHGRRYHYVGFNVLVQH
jgi:hypothetical protein